MLPDEGERRLQTADAVSGQQIGKYVIRCTIGAGGCGTVYAAYDPLLEREVALKLLTRTRGQDGETTDAGWATLVREARMLARLSEPQVVTVYDVGDDDGQAYLAMQMVTGGDLKDWIARHRGDDAADPRPLPAVLELLEQAGRGLSVAHEAGVVHGDFKPANVLVDKRGRAKVSDFGIARLAEAAARFDLSETLPPPAIVSALDTGDPSEGGEQALRTFTTGEGLAIVGTPAYMAPEQFDGAAADVVSDVYAFCATLYHAVYGVLPFAGGTLMELAARKTEGTLAPPRQPAVPTWLSKVIGRGLSVDRAQRYPTMAALLAELEAGRRPPRRRWFIAIGVGAGAGIAAMLMAVTASTQPGCEEIGDDFPWTEDVHQQVHAQLTEAGGASVTVDRITTRMDAFATEWLQTRTLACEATWAEPETAHQAFACLRRRRSVARALVQTWGEPDPKVDAAQTAVSLLASVTVCADANALAEQPDLPDEPALREKVIAARTQLDAATVRARLGSAADALGDAKAVYDEAAGLGYGPLIAQSALTYGQALAISGELEPARQRLRAAFFEAQKWDDHETAAAAAGRLVHVVGTRLDEHEEGLLWADHARVALSKTGGSTGILSGNEASILDRLGRHDEAVAAYETALRTHPKTDPYGHGVTHLRMGDALRALGRADEALSHYDQAIEKWTEVLGADHPRLAILSMSRATALDKLGRIDDAILAFQTARKGLIGLFGPDHINVASGTVNLGIALKHAKRYPEAEVEMREALRITLATYEEGHLKVGHRRDALGRLLTLVERPSDALAEHKKALAIYDAELPPEHADRVIVRLNVGDAHQAAGDHEAAVAAYEQAVKIARHGSDEALEGDALAYLGRGLWRAGRKADAQEPLGHAAVLLEGNQKYAASRTMALEWLAKGS